LALPVPLSPTADWARWDTRMAALDGAGHKAAGLNGLQIMLLENASALVAAHADLLFFELGTDPAHAIASLMRPKNGCYFLFHLLLVCLR